MCNGSLRGSGDLEDLAVLHKRINFAVRVFGKAANIIRLLEQHILGSDLFGIAIIAQTPEGAEVEIAVDVDAFEGGRFLAVIDVTADDAKAGAMIRKH